MNDLLERLRARADNAYCDYIGQLRRDECLGWEIKVERRDAERHRLKRVVRGQDNRRTR